MKTITLQCASLRASLAAAALATLASHPATAAERCFDFSRLAPDKSYAVGDSIPFSIGTAQVLDLPVNGAPAVGDPANKFLRVMNQRIAGGSAPEMYGKNVALQMVPTSAAKRITMNVSHQPGAAPGRPAFVEVNGERLEFNGSLLQLDGRTIGSPAPALLKVELPVQSGSFLTGRLRVRSQAGIESFTLGAAELRLDDVCFEN